MIVFLLPAQEDAYLYANKNLNYVFSHVRSK